jgi:hypothetical protein
MIPDTIPDGLAIPTEPIGMKKLAEKYRRSVRTLQREFKKRNIYEAIGEKSGYDFTPEQQLIIFYLYFPPSEYYKSFMWLDKNGYIEAMVKKYGLDEYHNKKKIINGNKKTTKGINSENKKNDTKK